MPYKLQRKSQALGTLQIVGYDFDYLWFSGTKNSTGLNDCRGWSHRRTPREAEVVAQFRVGICREEAETIRNVSTDSGAETDASTSRFGRRVFYASAETENNRTTGRSEIERRFHEQSIFASDELGIERTDCNCRERRLGRLRWWRA